MSDLFEIDVRELLARRVAEAPAAHAWSHVEKRAADPGRPVSPGGSRNVMVVWLAIAAATVLAVAGAVLFLRDDDVSVVVDEGPATTIDADQPEPTTDENGADEEGRSNDQEITPDDQQETTSGGFAPIEPGAWHLAATSADPSIAPGELDQIAAEVGQWPGVLDVETAVDAAAWERLTGLTSGLCDGVRSGPPCGPGVVMLLVDGQQQPIGRRLESELQMGTLSAASSTVEFVEAYFAAAVDLAAPAPLRFDPTSLGNAITLTGPSTDLAEHGACGLPECEVLDVVAVGVNVDGEDLRVSVALIDHESGPELMLETAGGTGFMEMSELLPGSGGRAGVGGRRWPRLGSTVDDTDRSAVILVGLPLEVAVVTAQLADGTTVWQRPLGGLAVLPDAQGSSGDFDPEAATTVAALDGDGEQILLIDVSVEEVMVTDLRVDPDRLAAAEASLAQIVAGTSRTVEAGDLSVTWSEVSWSADEGPGGNFMLWWTASTPTGDPLSLGDGGVVWRWVDDVRWQHVEGLRSYDIDWLEDGGDFVIASGRRRGDGEPVALRSTDGLIWQEIDMTGLGDGPILATSASGLSIVGEYPGIVAVIENGRVIEVHDPPWPAPTDEEGRQFFEVLDVEGGPVVIRQFRVWEDGDEGDEVGIEAWRYLGDGQWEAPVPIPSSDHVAVLDDTVLMFDRTGFETGDKGEIVGGTSEAPLLTTTNGTDWTVHSTLQADTTSGLRIEAGDFFWVYGLHGNSASMARYGNFATIWISIDAVDWFPLDVSFTDSRVLIKVVGDTIYVFGLQGERVWVGHVEAA